MSKLLRLNLHYRDHVLNFRSLPNHRHLRVRVVFSAKRHNWLSDSIASIVFFFFFLLPQVNGNCTNQPTSSSSPSSCVVKTRHGCSSRSAPRRIQPAASEDVNHTRVVTTAEAFQTGQKEGHRRRCQTVDRPSEKRSLFHYLDVKTTATDFFFWFCHHFKYLFACIHGRNSLVRVVQNEVNL